MTDTPMDNPETLAQNLTAIATAGSPNEYRDTSKIWYTVIYVIFIIYSVFTIIIHKKTEYRTNPEGDVKAIFWAFTKTIEKDIAPSLLVFGLAISLGTFHFFMMLLGMTLIAAIVILTLGYLKSAANLIRVGKFINVTVTILAFLNSFIDSME